MYNEKCMIKASKEEKVMESAIAILLGAAILLLVLSFVKTKQTTKNTEQQLEEITFTFTNELNKLQQQIRNLELDAEIRSMESGELKESMEQRVFLREILELYKRGYSVESIASKKKVASSEIENLLSPFMEQKKERRKVANGN